ncbi:MAG: hypothetical protein ABIB71_09775 [Candidatus Woesearchaeota archaeon]
MKRGIAFLLFVFLLVIPLALSEQNRLVIHFHSLTGTETTSIRLWDYFPHGTVPLISTTEHLVVTIDPKTGMATIKVIDPEFKGIEDVVFAVSKEYLEAEQPQPKYVVPWNRTKTVTGLEGSDLAEPGDAFTAKQFDTLIGKLEGESVSISAVKRRNTIGVLMGDQLFINISYNLTAGYVPPSIKLSFKLEESNRTAAEVYTEPSEIVFFSLSLIIMASLVVLVLYIYYAYSEQLQVSYSRMLITKNRVALDVTVHKKAALVELGHIRGRIGKENPAKLYRQTIAVMNRFLAKALKIRGSSSQNVALKLEKLGAGKPLISKINMYCTRYRDRSYTAKEITNSQVSDIISFVSSIIRNT